MQRRSPESVIDELQRRAREGRSLKSGDNRGDWLYASAVRFFGSWREAVEAAGFDYDEIVWRPLDADEVIARIQELADAGDSLVVANHKELQAPANRHFGSWKAAVKAAGREIPSRMKWPPEKVIETICSEMDQGLPMGGGLVNKRNPTLYRAARSRFGSWAAAMKAVTKARRKSRRPSQASKES